MLDDAEHSILRLENRRPRRSRVWLVGTISMAVGILVGLAADVALWQRLFTLPVTSASNSTPSPSSQPAIAESSTLPPVDVVAANEPRDTRDTSASNQPSTTAASRSTTLDAAGTGRSAGAAKDESRLSSTGQKATSAAQPSSAGSIRVLSRPQGAEVILDGNVIGQSPLLIADVPEGTHEVRVELAGFSPWVTSVRLKGGSQTRVSASLER
jgi:hypothetical protein